MDSMGGLDWGQVSCGQNQSSDVSWLTGRDMCGLMRLLDESFAEPMTEEEVIRRLRKRDSVALVAKDMRTGNLQGVVFYQLGSLPSMKILLLAVSPECRRKGVGSMLVGKLLGKLCERRHFITVCVPETNLRAQVFFRSLGFRAEGILKEWFDYYGGYEDAYVMRLHKDGSHATKFSRG